MRSSTSSSVRRPSPAANHSAALIEGRVESVGSSASSGSSSAMLFVVMTWPPEREGMCCPLVYSLVDACPGLRWINVGTLLPEGGAAGGVALAQEEDAGEA